MNEAVSSRSLSHPSVSHGTFTVRRRYDATPARVFAAWATAEAKARWSSCHDEDETETLAFDFSVGGREATRLALKNGPVYTVDAVYRDIVPGERIVYAYEMTRDGARISVSLATVEFDFDGTGTMLVFTDQGTYLDGADGTGREEGTLSGLERLDAELKRSRTSA